MQSNISACCFSLLLVHFIGAKPISDLQVNSPGVDILPTNASNSVSVELFACRSHLKAGLPFISCSSEFESAFRERDQQHALLL